MASSTRRIGLSLGADLCWPAAYESIVRELDLNLELGDETVGFEVEKVQVEPFDLQGACSYDLVLDRLTHWLYVSREWIKKIVLMDGVYVLNNPWAIQAYEKHTSYVAMMRLGLPIPRTFMIPSKHYDPEDHADLKVTVERYNKLFNLDAIGEQVGYPAFLKPYDGGGWVGVTQVRNAKELHAAYDASGKRVQHLQAAVKDWDVFARGIGIGPQVNVMRYDPSRPLHGRYVVDFHFLDAEDWARAQKITRVINAFHAWDFNSCEMLRADGVLHPIDFANACPDSQVTSLHFHFPWLVKALIRWSLFCAATRRRPTLHPNWAPYLEIADTPGLSFDEKLDRYDALAQAHFDSDRFEAFCEEHLADLDEVAWAWFGTEDFRRAVRAKVAALYPAHEVERFTEHFFGLVQFWRKTERDRLDGASE
ncbi:MAG: hypothetical protein EA397_01800 [Deltaproteobacteria bacterium]|nr:MAG: hypothetical protein EA397_01800 [Deltaproteobacteria bacterium]